MFPTTVPSSHATNTTLVSCQRPVLSVPINNWRCIICCLPVVSRSPASARHPSPRCHSPARGPPGAAASQTRTRPTELGRGRTWHALLAVTGRRLHPTAYARHANARTMAPHPPCVGAQSILRVVCGGVLFVCERTHPTIGAPPDPRTRSFNLVPQLQLTAHLTLSVKSRVTNLALSTNTTPLAQIPATVPELGLCLTWHLGRLVDPAARCMSCCPPPPQRYRSKTLGAR